MSESGETDNGAQNTLIEGPGLKKTNTMAGGSLLTPANAGP